MNKYLFLILIFIVTDAYGQKENLVLTKEENNRWFEKLKNEQSLIKRVNFINQRLNNDYKVYISVGLPDGISVKDVPVLDSLRKNRIKGYCKPLYILKYKSKILPFIFVNQIKYDKIEFVIKHLTNQNINNVEIWTDTRKIIYGGSGNCGIVLLETESKIIFNKFEKMNLPVSYYVY